MSDNPLGALIGFTQGLDESGISYQLDCVRNAIVVVIPCPDRYIEAEFFADGHVEVEFFGPPASDIHEFTPHQLLEAVRAHMEADADGSPLDRVSPA